MRTVPVVIALTTPMNHWINCWLQHATICKKTNGSAIGNFLTETAVEFVKLKIRLCDYNAISLGHNGILMHSLADRTGNGDAPRTSNTTLL
jgi:hypothetical protein